MYKSELEKRVDAMEAALKGGAVASLVQRVTSLESKLGIVNNGVTGLNARVIELESKILATAGAGATESARVADPSLAPVTLPPAQLPDPVAIQPVAGSEGEPQR